MNKNYISLLLLSVCCLFSCNNPKQTTLPPYFSLPDYMNSQIKILAANKTGAVKTISVNGKKEVHKFDILDWKEELQSFIDADINKPSWRGNFMVDTAYTVDKADTEKLITYSTEEPGIRTKKLVLNFDIHTKNITEVEAYNLTDNVLYHFEQQLFYFPMKSYFISTTEKVVLLNPSQLNIRGEMK